MAVRNWTQIYTIADSDVKCFSALKLLPIQIRMRGRFGYGIAVTVPNKDEVTTGLRHGNDLTVTVAGDPAAGAWVNGSHGPAA